jgi:hypothetical protein
MTSAEPTRGATRADPAPSDPATASTGVLALLGRRDVAQAAPPLPTEMIASVQADIDAVKTAVSR